MQSKEELKVELEEKYNFLLAINNVGLARTDKGIISNWSIDWIEALDEALKYYREHSNDILTEGISAVFISKLDKCLGMLRAQSSLKKILKKQDNICDNVQLLLLKKHTDLYALEQELKKKQ